MSPMTDTEYLVFGYITNLKLQNEIDKQMNIPKAIKNVCALFFGYIKRHDFFETCGDCMQINKSIDHKWNTKIQCWGKWNTTYGAIIMNPLFNKKYIWKFYIKNRLNGSICIGINQYDSNIVNKDFSGNKQYKNYAYCGGNGRKYSFKSCQSFINTLGVGDRVYMKLDFTINTKGVLSYCLIKKCDWNRMNRSKDECLMNGYGEYQIAFDDVDIDTKYKMAISIDQKWTVELEDFAEFYK